MRVTRKRAFTAFASLVLAVVTAGAAQAACGGDPTNLLGTWTLTSAPRAVVGTNP